MTPDTTSLRKSLLVSINDDGKQGHSADIRVSLKRSLTDIPYSIFQDRQRRPEHVFNTTVEEILLCDGILLDALSSSKHNPDVLIQFGISYALGKKVMFLTVRHSSQGLPSIASKIIGNYHVSFDYYLDLITTLKPKVSDWLRTDPVHQRIERNDILVHAFSVFGVEQSNRPDLHQTILDFPIETGWNVKFYQELGFVSPLKDLAKTIGVRSFCIFCLDKNTNENLYLGIGIAIGMGVPFLILQPEDVNIPESLGGYEGIIKFSSQSQLKEELEKYSEIFLSEQVRLWDGATFFQLLSRIEQQIEAIDDASELHRIEYLLHAINRSIRPTLPKPYILLGDVYREKVHKGYPQSIDYQQSIESLKMAIYFYENGLKIQSYNKRCSDSIASVNRQIEIIELLRERKYRSIPQLIRLIGEDITTDDYFYLREYLFVEVEKLIGELDYLNALALLAAMYLHDKSERIMEFIDRILAVAPKAFLDTIQNVQDYVITLEEDAVKSQELLADRNKQIEEFSFYLRVKSENLLEAKEKIEDLEDELNELKELLINKGNQITELTFSLKAEAGNLSEAREKIKDLENELNENLNQLNSVKAMHEMLNEISAQENVLKDEIEAARNLGGRGVLVNFGHGLGWAIFDALYGDAPYIIRDKKKFFAKRGMILIDNDQVYHSDGTHKVWKLPPEAISDKLR